MTGTRMDILLSVHEGQRPSVNAKSPLETLFCFKIAL